MTAQGLIHTGNKIFETKTVAGKTVGSGRIEEYRIISLLGKGSFSYVFEAEELLTGAPVAIKKIDKDWIRTTNNTTRIRNEAEIHLQLKHSSILQLHNFFEDEHSVYFILELCKQGDMYNFLKEKKKFSEETGRKYFRQLVEGLLFLHSKNIIHRDLKLSNILLNNSFDLKISDFGLSAKLEDSDEERRTVCGTANYIAPEILDHKPYGLSSDIWSLGVILHMLLTGTAPFPTQLGKSIYLNTRTSLGDLSLPELLSVEVRDLIGRLLHKDPKQRISLHEIMKHEWMSDILKPLLTTRLKPVSHKTKQGIIAITDSGDVQVTGKLFNFFISCNGIIECRVETPNGLRESFKLQELPNKYKKVYEYAFKFVNVIRAKTPKVVYHYSPQCKALLMESDRDFEFFLTNGIKLHYEINTKQWTWSTHTDHEKDPELQKLANACYQKCVLWAEIGQRSGDSFPLVISHKSATPVISVNSLSSISASKSPHSPIVQSSSSQGSASFSSFSIDSTSYVSNPTTNNQNSVEIEKMEKEIQKLKQDISNLLSEKETISLQLKESQQKTVDFEHKFAILQKQKDDLLSVIANFQSSKKFF